MRSMTAFARSGSTFSWGELVWEIRSVNHRYLEPGFRLPESMRFLEGSLREALKKRLARGKVDCNLQLTVTPSPDHSLKLNEGLASQYIKASSQVSDLMKTPAPVSPLEILLLPGVVSEPVIDTETLKKSALEGFEACVDQLLETRAREGEALKGFLASRLEKMESHVATLRGLMPEILAAQRDKLLTRLQEVAAEPDQARLEQEMVIQAQKMDVEEELDRLQAHLQEVQRVVQKGGVAGRRLDFLMQELNREANTLSSKSVHSKTTLAAVDMKVLIEQMREQVQNIE